MKPLYKIVTFLGLLAGFLGFAHDFAQAPMIYGRLLLIFVAGAVLALFVDGPYIGRIDPVSTRPAMVMLGVLLMAAGVVWMLAIRNHV